MTDKEWQGLAEELHPHGIPPIDVIVDYVLLFIETNMDEWYEFSMIDDASGDYYALEFDVVAKALSKMARRQPND